MPTSMDFLSKSTFHGFSLKMPTSIDFLSKSTFMPIFIPLFLLLIFLYIYKQPQKKKYHPIGGTVLHMLINFKKLHHYMTDLAAKYKTFRMINPFQGEIYTSDPTIVEYILKTNFGNYGKGKFTHEWLEDFLGDGIFTVDGDKWREQRKLSSHEFSTRILRDFSSLTFRKTAVKVGNIFSEAANSNNMVDINVLFMRATADSIFKVAFGIDLDNLNGSNEEGIRFSRAFDNANQLIYRRLVDLFWRIKRYLNIGEEAELRKNIKVVNEFVYKVIRIKTEKMNSKDDLLSKKEDILSRFLQINDKDPKYIRDIVLNFVLAGKDPIATTLHWFFYMLCKHPEVQDKVAKDIREAMNITTEDITNVADFEALLSDDMLEKMQYLHAALEETMRLHPSVPMDPKTCFSDDVLPDGCNVNKGDIVSYLSYAMGKMKFIWGEDAEDYKPERWLDQRGCFHPQSPFKFTAFQAGPRTCLGREFAYKQMKIFCSIILGCFVFKLCDENHVAGYKTTLNIQVDGPLNVYVSRRSG